MNYTVTKTDKQGKNAVDLFSEDFSENRRIWITGPIDAETARETVVALEYLDRIGNGEITVTINSPGGSVSDGLAILDAMRRCRCDIVTVATGMAASMGAFLAACGGTAETIAATTAAAAALTGAKPPVSSAPDRTETVKSCRAPPPVMSPASATSSGPIATWVPAGGLTGSAS